MSIRINKFLSSSGFASRRQADQLIASGQVLVNGKIAALGQKINPDQDEIVVNDRQIKAQKQKYLYLILNKPAGFVTTTARFQSQHSVMELISVPKRVFPVGRLDKDTTGLLLFTNDGRLPNKLIHPRRHLAKTYLLTLKSLPTRSQFKLLQTGVPFSDGITLPSQAKVISSRPPQISLTIFQGRNRQIRRMCQAVNLSLLALHRQSLGPLVLGNLEPGHWRHLTPSEISLLEKVV